MRLADIICYTWRVDKGFQLRLVQALATAVDTFAAVLETHRWVPSSRPAARSRRTTDDRSVDGASTGEPSAPAPLVLLRTSRSLSFYGQAWWLTLRGPVNVLRPRTIHTRLTQHARHLDAHLR